MCGIKRICRWRLDVVVKGLYNCKVVLRVGLILCSRNSWGKSKTKKGQTIISYTVFSHADFYTTF